MKKLSLVIITKNEELKLGRCLSSVKDIVDEIIIVDTGSTDNTKCIATEFNAKIFDYQWDNNFSNARNFAISKSTGDWNLILDADEYLTDVNLMDLHNFMNSHTNVIGRIKRIDFFEQDGQLKKSSSFISRLAPKNILYSGSIHEQLDLNLPRKDISIVAEHDGYIDTNKFDRNIALILVKLKHTPDDVYFLYQAGKTYYINKNYPEAEYYFDKFYKLVDFSKDGMAEDGILTYLYALLKTGSYEKGLKIINEVFELMSNYCDFYFVCGLFFTELVAFNTEKYIHLFNNIELFYLKAIELGKGDGIEFVDGTGSYLAEYNLNVFYNLLNPTD